MRERLRREKEKEGILMILTRFLFEFVRKLEKMEEEMRECLRERESDKNERRRGNKSS